MKEPVWITLEVMLATQDKLLSRFGGLPGIRDEGLLESALHRPRQLFASSSPELFDLAAAYAAGIIQNHPFLDGNKRAGFMAAYIFLGANGWEVEAPEEEVVVQTLGLAAGEIPVQAYARWLKSSSDRGQTRR